jgi:hypothetical protein
MNWKIACKDLLRAIQELEGYGEMSDSTMFRVEDIKKELEG